MIQILLSATGLTPSITIQDDTNTTVSSGVMVEGLTSLDGRFWYSHDYTGTPGAQYHIMIDAGASITETELRYFDFYALEEGFNTDAYTRLFSTATKGDVSFTPSITFEEKKQLFKLLDALEKKKAPTLDITPFTQAVQNTNNLLNGVAKPSDLQVTVTMAPDDRITAIVTAINDAKQYMQPDKNIESMARSLETLSRKELDKEAIQTLYDMIKEMPVDHIDEVKDTFMESIRESLETIITQEIVKSVMKESAGALLDQMMNGNTDKTPLHEKLMAKWKQ